MELAYKGVTCFIPTSMDELVGYKKEDPSAAMVVGSSEVGIDIKYRGRRCLRVYACISTHKVPELYHINMVDDNLVFAATTSSTRLSSVIRLCPVCRNTSISC